MPGGNVAGERVVLAARSAQPPASGTGGAGTAVLSISITDAARLRDVPEVLDEAVADVEHGGRAELARAQGRRRTAGADAGARRPAPAGSAPAA